MIEILVVVAIIGILTTITYSAFDASKAQGRDSTRISDISLIKLSLEEYYNKNHQYPPALQDLVTAGFLPSVPADPSTQSPYGYFPLVAKDSSSSFNTYCTFYQLWTTLETNNQILLQKKGLDSTGITSTDDGGTNFLECSGADESQRVDASSNPKIYDVMPL